MEPRLGANAEELQTLFRCGIVPYGPSFDNLLATLRRFVQQVRASTRTPILSVLLEGSARYVVSHDRRRASLCRQPS